MTQITPNTAISSTNSCVATNWKKAATNSVIVANTPQTRSKPVRTCSRVRKRCDDTDTGESVSKAEAGNSRLSNGWKSDALIERAVVAKHLKEGLELGCAVILSSTR